MTSWNPDQLQAITSRQKNVIVSASAGAGKTTVLIERLVRRVLDDHIQIQEILAMTFTEAAASEMKKRLADQLHQKLHEAQDDDVKQYIQTQLSQLQNANISTIHSFCLSIVQKYYYFIELSPKRVNYILDQNEVKMCQMQALEKAFTKQRQQQSAAFLRLCQIHSPRAESEEALQKTILNIATFASAQADPEAFFVDMESRYQTYKSIQAIPDEIRDNFFDYYATMLELWHDSLTELYTYYEKTYPGEVKKMATLQQKIAACSAIKKEVIAQAYEPLRTGVIAICGLVTPTSPDREDAQYKAIRTHILGLEDAILKHLHSEITLLKDIEHLCGDVHKLIEITKDYRAFFALEKAKANGIDFDDMEHFALAILQANHGYVGNIYRQQFKEIMVDEFQDSNDVQHTLVSLICQPNNVFRVGDIKQSIYGFRHALPQLMKGLLNTAGVHDDTIFLRSNYRSKQSIVDFNNQLFDKLMNVQGFDSSYQANDYVTTGAPHQQLDNHPITFHGIHYDAISDDLGYKIHNNVCKASYIASQIMDCRNKQQRKWKDFVVLVRSNARKADMKAALDELHIPCFVDVKSGFYQSDAIQILLSCLTVGINPHDDIVFVSVLLSSIGGLDSETLAQAALQKEKDVSYYRYFQTHPFPAFYEIEQFIQQVPKISLSQAILAIYELHDFYQTQSIQDKTNLDSLYQIAYHQEIQTGQSIAGFLQHIDKIADMEIAQAIPIGSDEDVVRVMSIHQSKGLQFPVVFLWSTSKQPTIDFQDLSLMDNKLGIALKHMDLPQRYVRTTIHRIAMEHKKNRAELEEEMRILYVALTRAQEQMHIVDYVKDEQVYLRELNRARIYQRGGYTSWILHTFMNQANPLFQYLSIQRKWVKEINPIMDEKTQPLPMYQLPTSTIHFQTASDTHYKDLSTLLLRPSKAGASRGSALHECIATKLIPNIQDIILGYTIQAEDVDQLLALYQNAHFIDAQAMSHTYYEYPYTIKEGDTIYHGFMDFIGYDSSRAIIIDFKSDRDVDESTLRTNYQEQLNQYQYAFQQLHPTLPISCFIYSLSLRVMISIK